MARISRSERPSAVIEVPGFAAPGICQRAIGAFDSLAHLHVARAEDAGHRVIHYGALGARGTRMDEFGHLAVEPSLEQSLKAWLNSLRASIPGRFGLGAVIPELTLLCRAPDGSAMPGHRDYSWRSYSAILYLNDEFEGGETCFEDGGRIRPETGKLAIFPGSALEHWVEPVHGGARYNVSLWWTSDALRLEA